MKLITNISGNVSNGNFSAPSQQMTVGDFTNPRFARAIQLTNNGLVIYRPGITVGIPMADILAAAVSADPNLTWVPVYSLQPSNVTTNHSSNSNACNFQTAASCESGISITYQWQLSTDNGGNWANQANGGVYSNMTTNTMHISNTNGLNSYSFRVRAYNVAGNVASNLAKLTVS